MQARKLLHQARLLYDDPDLPFADLARYQGWKRGFTSGADWMRRVMEHLQDAEITPNHVNYQFYGCFKYGLATLGSLLCLALIITSQEWVLLPLCILIFYAIEAQMVFLFPLLIEGHSDAVKVGRQLVNQAGGTIAVMITVMQLALVMLFGGLVGQGFVRSWALGCLAVCIWYMDVQHATARVS